MSTNILQAKLTRLQYLIRLIASLFIPFVVIFIFALIIRINPSFTKILPGVFVLGLVLGLAYQVLINAQRLRDAGASPLLSIVTVFYPFSLALIAYLLFTPTKLTSPEQKLSETSASVQNTILFTKENSMTFSSSGRDVLAWGIGVFLFFLLPFGYAIQRGELYSYLWGLAVIILPFAFFYIRRSRLKVNASGVLVQNPLTSYFIDNKYSIILRVASKIPWWTYSPLVGPSYLPTLIFQDKKTGRIIAETSLFWFWRPGDLAALSAAIQKFTLPITIHPSFNKWLQEGAYKLFPFQNKGRYEDYDDVIKPSFKNDIPLPPKSPKSIAPSPTPPVPPPTPVKSKKDSTLTIIIFVALVIIAGVSLVITLSKKSSQLLPFEQAQKISSPKDRIYQEIGSNVVFKGITSANTPQVSVSNDEKTAVPVLLNTKQALTNTDSLIEKPTGYKKRLNTIITGETTTPISSDSSHFELRVSTLDEVDKAQYRYAEDTIMNGQIGSVKLNDENQEALHLSLTQTRSDNGYLRIDMSDYLLVFLNRFLKKDAGSNGGIISVNTDDIWPYLGKYLHIPRALEEKQFGEDLPADDKKLMADMQGKVAEIAQKTIGSAQSYTAIRSISQETIASQPATKFEVEVLNSKLIQAINDYYDQTIQLYTQHQSEINTMCVKEKQEPGRQEKCTQAGEDVISKNLPAQRDLLTKLIEHAMIQNVTAYVSDVDFSLVKLTATATITNTQTASGWDIPLPIKTVMIQIDNEMLARQASFDVSVPPKIVDILVADSADKASKISDETSFQNKLYEENKNFFLTKSYNPQISRNVCSGKPDKTYCLSVFDNWDDFTATVSGRNNLLLSRQHDVATDSETTTISIDQETTPTNLACSYEDNKQLAGLQFRSFKEITTKDNVSLRLGTLEQSDSSLPSYISVCSKVGPNFADITPYGHVTINPGNKTFDDLFPELNTILSSLKAQFPVTQLLNEQQNGPSFSPTSIPNPTTKVETITDPNTHEQYVYISGSQTGKKNCAVSTNYITSTYSLGQNGFALVQDSLGVCTAADTCSLCVNGSFQESTNLSLCKGQPCNP